jgi:hypothetical protein
MIAFAVFFLGIARFTEIPKFSILQNLNYITLLNFGRHAAPAMCGYACVGSPMS